MGGYLNYIAVFQTPLIQAAQKKIVVQPLKIELFKGPRRLQVPIQTSRVLVKGREGAAAHGGVLNLGDDFFLSLSVRTNLEDPAAAKKYCEERIDRAIANLSVLFDPDLFAHQAYRGWIYEGGRIAMEAWVRAVPPLTVAPGLYASLESMVSAQSKDPEMQERYFLMSRFLAKSLLFSPGEEKFLYLWTILEIFPMKDTTDIRPISEFLAKITGHSAPVVKEALGIGRLFGLRSDLVHNGKFGLSSADLGPVICRLEMICLEVLRAMSGLAYSGSLDRFLSHTNIEHV